MISRDEERCVMDGEGSVTLQIERQEKPAQLKMGGSAWRFH